MTITMTITITITFDHIKTIDYSLFTIHSFYNQ